MMRYTILLFFVLFTITFAQKSSHKHKEKCPPCELNKCDNPVCPSGQVIPEGPCSCCPVCALNEGEMCYNATLKVLKKPKLYIPCGENMKCLLRTDLTPRDAPEALCTCIQTENVCGTDGNTYDNVCQLQFAAGKYGTRNGQILQMAFWGPCKSEPEITSSPQDALGHLGQAMALDCEAKGYPIPEMHWEFQGDDGGVRNLPSDDLYVAVQVRGGPEAYMVSSWVQIVDLRPTDTGIYTCVATNSEGHARASATIGVQKVAKQRRGVKNHHIH